MTNPELYVDMSAIGLAEHGIPFLPYTQFVLLAQRAVNVYNLTPKAQRITFEVLLEHIKQYIDSPFGKRCLKELCAAA